MGHCAATSDGGQEKDEDPLLTKEVKGTTDREQERARVKERGIEKERDIEKENTRNRGRKPKKGTILNRIRPSIREREMLHNIRE